MYFVSGLKEEIAYLDLLMECFHVFQPANPMSVLFTSLDPWSVVIVLKCSLKKWFFEVLWNIEVCPKLGAYLCCSLFQGAAVCTSLGEVFTESCHPAACAPAPNAVLWQKTFIGYRVPCTAASRLPMCGLHSVLHLAFLPLYRTLCLMSSTLISSPESNKPNSSI